MIAFIGFQSFKNYKPNVYHKVKPFKSGGLALKNGDDATGGPYNTAECIDCHGGGSYAPTIQVNLFDSNMNNTSAYIPGDTYKVQLVISATSGSPAGYGMQAVALNNSNQQAGNFSSAISLNSQITSLSGRQYIEQNGYNVSGVFEYNWVAPTTGTGNVKIYGVGLAVNGSGTSGDSQSPYVIKTITESALSITDLNLKDRLKLYPNPSPGKIHIDLGMSYEKLNLTVTNTLGQIVLTKTESNTDNFSFSMEGKTGLYFATIYNNLGEQANIKFIVK